MRKLYENFYIFYFQKRNFLLSKENSFRGNYMRKYGTYFWLAKWAGVVESAKLKDWNLPVNVVCHWRHPSGCLNRETFRLLLLKVSYFWKVFLVIIFNSPKKWTKKFNCTFLFILLENWRHQKDILKLTDL